MSTALTSTTLAAALSNQSSQLTVASGSGIYAPANGGISQKLYVINPETTKGEIMDVTAINGVAVSVSRLGLFRQAFISGAYVIIGQSPGNESIGLGPSFFEYDPVGSVAAVNVPITPWINVTNGNQDFRRRWNLDAPNAFCFMAGKSLIQSSSFTHCFRCCDFRSRFCARRRGNAAAHLRMTACCFPVSSARD